MAESWAHFSKETLDQKEASVKLKSVLETPKKTDKPPECAGSPPNKRPKEDDVPPKEPKPKEQTPKKPKLDEFVLAMRVRNHFHSVTGSVNTLIEEIQGGNPDWSWANNSGTMQPIQELKDKIFKSMGEFGKKFVCSDPKALKQQYQPEVLERELKAFSLLSEPLKELQKAHSRLCAMQNAALKASGVSLAPKPKRAKGAP
eukprot:1860676-Alexandrium_andersonii.AAC.1